MPLVVLPSAPVLFAIVPPLPAIPVPVICRPPFPAAVGVLPNQFLLLGVHRDDRQALGDGPPADIVDVAELGGAVAEGIFRSAISLPSSSSLGQLDRARVIDSLERAIAEA